VIYEETYRGKRKRAEGLSVAGAVRRRDVRAPRRGWG